MTKTFCDRCGKESPVKKLNLSDGTMSLEIIDACDLCIRAISEAFRRLPEDGSKLIR